MRRREWDVEKEKSLNSRRNQAIFDVWYHQESNRGHTDFQSVALPTELWYHHLKNSENDVFLISECKDMVKNGNCKGYGHFFSYN